MGFCPFHRRFRFAQPEDIADGPMAEARTHSPLILSSASLLSSTPVFFRFKKSLEHLLAVTALAFRALLLLSLLFFLQLQPVPRIPRVSLHRFIAIRLPI